MTAERRNELLRVCEVELSKAEFALQKLVNSDEDLSEDPEAIFQMNYLMARIEELTREFESYLQML